MSSSQHVLEPTANNVKQIWVSFAGSYALSWGVSALGTECLLWALSVCFGHWVSALGTIECLLWALSVCFGHYRVSALGTQKSKLLINQFFYRGFIKHQSLRQTQTYTMHLMLCCEEIWPLAWRLVQRRMQALVLSKDCVQLPHRRQWPPW